MEHHSPPDPRARELVDPSKTGSFPQSPPKLGIVHLLVWIGCALLYFSLTQFISGAANAPRLGRFDVFGVLHIAHGIGAAVGIGYIAMLTRRRWYDMPFPSHPGEFLAVLFGINVLVSLAARGILAYLDINWPLYQVTRIPYCLVLAIFVNWAFRNIPEPHWRTFLIVFGIVALIRLAKPGLQLFSMVHASGLIPLIALLAVAIFLDRTHRVPRPWTHWVGIGLQIWTWGIQLIVQMIILQKLGRGFWL